MNRDSSESPILNRQRFAVPAQFFRGVILQ